METPDPATQKEEPSRGRRTGADASDWTQSELAYHELSHRLLIGEIAPNERIIEQFWAEKLGVNRAAVRESLTRLLGEGLLHQGQRGGFFVNEMTEVEIHETREIREILETSAFAMACDRATPEQIKDLEETCNDFSNFVSKGYLTGAHEADLRFHRLLVSASGNARMFRIYEQSHIPLFQRKTPLLRAPIEDFMATEKEHRQILEALQKREKKAGIEALRRHFARGEKDALS